MKELCKQLGLQYDLSDYDGFPTDLATVIRLSLDSDYDDPVWVYRVYL